MKRLLLAGLAALSLAACATTPTVYQPAAGPNAVGYSDYRIEPGRYRVMFQGGTGAPPEQVMDYAIMRAADLTLSEGFDWFRVSDSSVVATGGGSSGPHIGLGIGGASFGGASAVGVGVGTGFDLGGSRYGASAATVEVFMGHGSMPAGLNVYDARAVRRAMGHPA
jgi:hypothetical protein